MMRRCPRFSVCAIALACLAAGAWGQATTAPAGAAAEAASQPKPQPVQVTAQEGSGVAQYLLPGEGEKWQPLKVGDTLDERTVIRTGFGSTVVLAFADNSTVKINRATKMGIGQFRKAGEVTRTRIGLKYGSMRMNVSRARGPNDFTVATPVATLAVSGSGSRTGFSDFGLLMKVDAGSWAVNMGPKHRNYNTGEVGDGKRTSTEITKRRRHVPLGDLFGLGKTEKDSLIYLGGGRGVIGLGGAGEGGNRILRRPRGLITRLVKIRVPGLDIDIGM